MTSAATRYVGMEYAGERWFSRLGRIRASSGKLWVGTITVDGRWPNGRLVAAVDDGDPALLTPNQTRRLISHLERALAHMERKA